MKILLIDDDRDVREAIGRGLKLRNHTVETCSDGEAAIDAIENSGPFDAIICDFDMYTPGWKVLKKFQTLYPNELHRFAFHSGSHLPTLMSFGVHVIPSRFQ